MCLRFLMLSIGLGRLNSAFALDASAQARPAAKVVSYSDMLNWSGSLLLVLLVFFVCVWLMRKSGQFASSGRENLKVLAGLSLGVREKVVLIRVGDKQLLLGVTPGRVEKLLELEGDERLFQEAEVAGNEFAVKLLQAIKRRGG